MYRIDRDDLPAIFLVSTTVLVLGAIAATIDSVVGGKGGFEIEVDPRGGGIRRVNESLDNESLSGSGVLGQEQTIDLVICLDFLTTTPAILAIVAVIGLGLYGVARRYNTATSILTGTGVIPVVWGAYFFLTNCFTTETGGWTLFTGQAVVTNEGTIHSPSLPPALVAGLIGVFVVAGLAFLTTVTRGTDEPPAVEQTEEDVPRGAAVGRAAGRAAERIAAANVPVDNAVYRAWLEMTRHLDIENPETTPPREFAGAAVDAGLDRADVAELTELFTEVRYGGKGAADREDRALAILRRIEESYGGAEAVDTEGAADGAATEGASDGAAPEGGADGAATEGASDGAAPEGAPDGTTTEGAADGAATEGAADGAAPEGGADGAAPEGGTDGAAREGGADGADDREDAG